MILEFSSLVYFREFLAAFLLQLNHVMWKFRKLASFTVVGECALRERGGLRLSLTLERDTVRREMDSDFDET